MFVNYPLGFESGRFGDKTDQFAVVRQALGGFESITTPTIESMDFEWQAGWDIVNKREKNTLDSRSQRTTEPQYQTEADRRAAEN
jgi:hypothetical protein